MYNNLQDNLNYQNTPRKKNGNSLFVIILIAVIVLVPFIYSRYSIYQEQQEKKDRLDSLCKNITNSYYKSGTGICYNQTCALKDDDDYYGKNCETDEYLTIDAETVSEESTKYEALSKACQSADQNGNYLSIKDNLKCTNNTCYYSDKKTTITCTKTNTETLTASEQETFDKAQEILSAACEFSLGNTPDNYAEIEKKYSPSCQNRMCLVTYQKKEYYRNCNS